MATTNYNSISNSHYNNSKISKSQICLNNGSSEPTVELSPLLKSIVIGAGGVLSLSAVMPKQYRMFMQRRALYNPLTTILCGVVSIGTIFTVLKIGSFVRYLRGGQETSRLRADSEIVRITDKLQCYEHYSYKHYNPFNLTIRNKHFAAKQNGLDGIMRIRGFGKFFTPILNVFGTNISIQRVLLFTVFGINFRLNVPYSYLNYEMNSCRVSDDEIVTKFRLINESLVPYWEQLNYSEFGSDDGRVFIKGYLDEEGAPRVKIQTEPFIQCDVDFSLYTNLRIRSGPKPNLGYMEFNSKKLNGEELTIYDIPHIAEALVSIVQPKDFEPSNSLSEGGSGDVCVVMTGELCEEVQSHAAGHILPAILDAESTIIFNNRASEEYSYKARLQDYMDEEFYPEDNFVEYREEFIEFVTRGCLGTLSPQSETVILEQQSRPSQVRDYTEIIGNVLDPAPQNQIFMKSEVYPPKSTAKRIINNPPPSTRVYTAMFISSFSTYFKNGPMRNIMGFGNAAHIDDCFNKIVDQAWLLHDSDILETDFEKMDANISEFFRELEQMIGEKLFASEYVDDWNTVHSAQFANRKPKTKFGTPYNLGFSRRSGEGGTSMFNSLINAFVMYCSFRIEEKSIVEAFSAIGIVGGDDGLLTGVKPETLVQVGKSLRLPIKVIVKTKNEPISFLGQVRPVRDMNLYILDIARWAIKVPYADVRGVPWYELAYRKVEPTLRTYPNVPIVSEYCKAVMRLIENQIPGFQPDVKYDELCRGGKSYILGMMEGTFLNTGESHDEIEILTTYVCTTWGLTPARIDEIENQLRAANNFSEFPKAFVKYDNPTILESTKVPLLFKDMYVTPHIAPIENVKKEETDSSEGSIKGCQKQQQTISTKSSTDSVDGKENKKKAKKRKRKKSIVTDSDSSGSSLS